MIYRFDHAVIAVRDLNNGIERYRSLGFDVSPGGRHTGRGTHNAIIRFGLDYLEIISIYDEAEARASGGNREYLASFLRDHDGGLVGYALATDDIEAEAERFRSTGLEADGPFAMQRQRPDGGVLSWRLLVPHGEQWGHSWPFLIEWDAPDDERLMIERAGAHSNTVSGVAGIRVATSDLESAIHLYRDQLGLGESSSPTLEGREPDRATFAVGRLGIELYTRGSHEPNTNEPREGITEVLLRAADPDRARSMLTDPALSVVAGR